MYAATSKSVFPNDGVLARAANNAAIDKFEKAKQVDPSVAEEANTLIYGSGGDAGLPSVEHLSLFRHHFADGDQNTLYFVTMILTVAAFYIILALDHQDVMIFLKEMERDAVNKLLLGEP